VERAALERFESNGTARGRVIGARGFEEVVGETLRLAAGEGIDQSTPCTSMMIVLWSGDTVAAAFVASFTLTLTCRLFVPQVKSRTPHTIATRAIEKGLFAGRMTASEDAAVAPLVSAAPGNMSICGATDDRARLD
jgi:hypothetical protein